MDPLSPPLHPQLQNSHNATSGSSMDDEIDLFELWNTLVEYKRSVLLVAFLCFSAATTLAYIITPRYRADVLAVPADDAKGGGGLASLAGQFGGLAELAGVNLSGNSSGKEAAIAYLQSQVFLEGFIREKNLMPVLYAKKWDATTNKWNVEDPKDIPTLWEAHQLFSKKILSVSADKKTGLITLSVEWKNREQAVEWANDLIKRANSSLRQKAIAEAETSLAYLEKELQRTSIVEVQQAIFRVMESQIKTKMMANVQEQFAFKVVDPAALMNEDAYVKPKRPLMMFLGLFGGLVLGGLLAFVRKAIQKRSTSAQ